MNLRESTLKQRSVVDDRSQDLFSRRGDLNITKSLNDTNEGFSLKLNYFARHQKLQNQQRERELLIVDSNLADNLKTTDSHYHLTSNFCKADKKNTEVIGNNNEARNCKNSSTPAGDLVKKRSFEMMTIDGEKQPESSSFSTNLQSNMSSIIAIDSRGDSSHYDLNDKLSVRRNKKVSDCDINKQPPKRSKEQLSKRVKRKSSNRDAYESHKLGDELICSCDERFSKEQSITDNINIQDEAQIANNEPPSPTFSPKSRIFAQHRKLVSLGERNGRSICNKHMPWFGIDVGGSLIKVVFFDPKETTREETVTLRRIRRYLRSSKPYGTTGKRDTHLEMPNCVINKRLGSLHFIRFATSHMPQFLEMAKNKRFADTISTVCATGGGAYKFEEDIKTNLGITLHKTDELDSIIYGIHYIDKYNSERECYYLEDPLDDAKCVKVPYDFSRPYPYLVVNIGSGVSILAVYSSTSYSRISGSSIGGGTFLGLCSLLTQCKTFDEAIRQAKAGSSTKIDKLVKDIYGGDYPKFNLSGDTVASSFGHMNMAEKRKDVKREDLARALLEMVTINIGSIARMCAANEDIDRVVFIGNFLRVNQLSMKLLSYAVNYWSKGAMKALFLEHEGYFGAVGCFVESTRHLG